MGNSDSIGAIFMVLVILLVIFLVFREVFCWYSKINQRVALLTEIRDLLKGSGAPAGVMGNPHSSQTPTTGSIGAAKPAEAKGGIWPT